MTEPVLSQKADLALANLTSEGGLLSPEQNDVFIRQLIDEPTLINECRTVTMSGPQIDLNKIGFANRILRPATQARTNPDTFPGDRALPVAQRSRPGMSKITLTTKEVIAEVRIPYEVLEDNIERGGMENTILQLIASRAALDLEELLIQGDTANGGDAYLAMMDGVVKRMNQNVVDNANAPIDANTFNRSIKALPTRYRRNRSQMRFYSSMDIEQDYRMRLTARGTDLGDAILTGDKPVPVFGVPLKGAALMPQDKLVFTNPQNIIFGIQRNVRIESNRQIQDREVVIVLTARIGVQIEDAFAGVKVINIGASV